METNRKGHYFDADDTQELEALGPKAERRNKLGALAVVVLLVALLSLLMLTTGCTADRMYVETTKGTHDIVFPDHRRYITQDASLDDDQKARRLRLLEAQEEADKAALGK